MELLRQIMADEQIDTWGTCPFDPSFLLPRGARNRLPDEPEGVVVILFGYYTNQYTDRNVSRYAIPDDYHTVIGDKLAAIAARLERAFPEETFVPFVDASPVHEVAVAVCAGLGCVGQNGLLLSPVYGSYCFVATLVTTLPLGASGGERDPLCNACGACVRACPTGALSENGFDRTRCRSQITQKKGELNEWEQAQIRAGGLVWGCDLCTDACPINRTAQKSRVQAFYEHAAPVLTDNTVEELSARKAYGWRGVQVLRRNLKLVENP